MSSISQRLRCGLARQAAKAAAPQQPAPDHVDGAIQILSILQRDARLIDFLMEDISSYSDDQIGAAVRAMHASARESLTRYVSLAPVVDGDFPVIELMNSMKSSGNSM